MDCAIEDWLDKFHVDQKLESLGTREMIAVVQLSDSRVLCRVVFIILETYETSNWLDDIDLCVDLITAMLQK